MICLEFCSCCYTSQKRWNQNTVECCQHPEEQLVLQACASSSSLDPCCIGVMWLPYPIIRLCCCFYDTWESCLAICKWPHRWGSIILTMASWMVYIQNGWDGISNDRRCCQRRSGSTQSTSRRANWNRSLNAVPLCHLCWSYLPLQVVISLAWHHYKRMHSKYFNRINCPSTNTKLLSYSGPLKRSVVIAG